MAGLSDIEWTDATWNPIAGCAMVSPGCTNCYAMRMAARLQAMEHPSYRGTTRKSGGRPVWTGKVNLVRKALDIPLRWKKPRKIFVNSMSDLFQDGIPSEFIAEVWKTMVAADHHVYQILTKRPENMKRVIESLGLKVASHIWLGTSVESEKFVERVSILRDTPAAIRFVSFEPLLGPVGPVDLSRIHWAIVGGESGPGSRPIEHKWVREIKAQCRKHDTAFFSNNGAARTKRPLAGNITAERGMNIRQNQCLVLPKADYCHGTNNDDDPQRFLPEGKIHRPACAIQQVSPCQIQRSACRRRWGICVAGLGCRRALVPSAFSHRNLCAFLFSVENRGVDKVLGALQASPFRGGIIWLECRRLSTAADFMY